MPKTDEESKRALNEYTEKLESIACKIIKERNAGLGRRVAMHDAITEMSEFLGFK